MKRGRVIDSSGNIANVSYQSSTAVNTPLMIPARSAGSINIGTPDRVVRPSGVRPSSPST